MRLLLDDAQIDHIVVRRRVFLRGGIVLMVLPFFLPSGWGFGLTGFMILSLGIYASVFTRWRTEPGLWMLGLFLVLSLGTSWGYFEFLSLSQLFAKALPVPAQPKAWKQIGFAADSGIALILFGMVVRFAASVGIANWSRTGATTRDA